MPYTTLWARMFDQYSEKKNPQHFYNILLVVGVVHCFAIDTSICERGFSLMNLLKTARRSRMGNKLLRMLMSICTLGADAGWKDPAKIPVQDIIDIWRDESKRGRYEGKLWKAHMLELDLGGSSSGGGGGGGSDLGGSSSGGGAGGGGSGGSARGRGGGGGDDAMGSVDARDDGGHFARPRSDVASTLGCTSGTAACQRKPHVGM